MSYIDKIIDGDGNEYNIVPSLATSETVGGIYAETIEDTSGMVEVAIGANGKAYAKSTTDEQIQNAVNEYLEENPVSGVVTDNNLDVNSVNPVQNKVITQALTTGVMEIKGMPSLEGFEVDWENGSLSGETGLPDKDATKRIRTSNYIPIDTQTVVSVKENADIEFSPMYYGENQKFISALKAFQTDDLVIEGGGNVKFIKIMARKKSNPSAAIGADYGNNLSFKHLVDNATIKAFYTPNEVDEKISQVGTIDTVFDANSTNAMANNSILEVFKTGKINVFDYSDSGKMDVVWEVGALDNSGQPNDVKYRARTATYIPITDNPITIKTSGNWQFCPYYYNENKSFISSPNTYQTDDLVVDSSTVPNAAYIKILGKDITITSSGVTVDLNSITIEVYGTEDTKIKQTKKVMYTSAEVDNLLNNYWQGKTLIYTGDSIPHGQIISGNVATPYPNIVAKNLGMTLKNYSIGGSTFAKKSNYGGAFGSKTDFDNAEKDTSLYYDVITGQTYTTYGYDTDSASWKSVGAGASRTPLSERLHLMEDGDLIIYAGGTNDFQYNWTEVGTMEDRDNTTFYGALHVTMLALLEKYYGKQIIFCTPIKRCQNPYTTITSKNNSGLTLKEYGNIIKEVCDYYSIPVIDLYSVSGLNPHVASQSTLFDSYKTHPLQAGHDILGAVMTTRIRATRNA